MSVVKMKLASIIGPISMIEQTIQDCVAGREFHPVDTIRLMRSVKSLLPFDEANPYSEALKNIKDIAGTLGTPLVFGKVEAGWMDMNYVNDYIKALTGEFGVLEEERTRLLLTAADNEQIIGPLEHIHGIDEELSGFLNMQFVKFRFGRIPRDTYEMAADRISDREDCLYIDTSVERDFVYGMYFTLPRTEDRVDAFFGSLSFERIWISRRMQNTSVTVGEAVLELKREAENSRARALELDKKIKALAERERDRLLASYSWLRFAGDAFEIMAYAGRTADNFYLSGWIPADTEAEFLDAIEAYPELSCTITDAGEVSPEMPPVKVKRRFLSRIYAPFIEMYGMPAYNEIDPGFFLAATYTVLFGIMYGDVGQGIALFFVGLLMYKRKGMWLGKILAAVGVSATAFGFVYGSVFGYEDILPGFKVLEGENTMRILIIAVVLGVALILTCMVMNIINGIRQKDIGKIFFSANGVAGLVFYLAVAAGAVGMFLLDISLFSTPYILCLIVLPLLIIFLKEPLTKLVKGEKDWMPNSIPGFIGESFFELFETILSYASNTISFLRVGAFAISHAGMMMVVFLLANGGENIAVVIIGNIVVMGLEGLLVCIQVLRLEFYEMFGRFYDGSGKAFNSEQITVNR